MQFLKEEVRERIVEAALTVFAAQGFAGASMAGIAAEAGISAGNIYRYFGTKEELFDAAVPEAFVQKLSTFFTRRIHAMAGVRDVGDLPGKNAYSGISEAFVAFALANRRRVIILLARSEGSSRHAFPDELLSLLMGLAQNYGRSIGRDFRSRPQRRFTLQLIYQAFLQAMVHLLETYPDDDEFRIALDDYQHFHLAGLKAFFAHE